MKSKSLTSKTKRTSTNVSKWLFRLWVWEVIFFFSLLWQECDYRHEVFAQIYCIFDNISLTEKVLIYIVANWNYRVISYIVVYHFCAFVCPHQFMTMKFNILFVGLIYGTVNGFASVCNVMLKRAWMCTGAADFKPLIHLSMCRFVCVSCVFLLWDGLIACLARPVTGSSVTLRGKLKWSAHSVSQQLHYPEPHLQTRRQTHLLPLFILD